MKNKDERNLWYSMAFEIAMMQFFGERAHHIASYAGNKTLTKKWLLRAVRRMMRDINKIDTTVRHKETMLSDLEYLGGAIKKWDNLEEIIFGFFMLCGKLLGYYGYRAHCHIPVYWQTPGQYYMTEILRGGDVMQDYHDRKDTISVRRKLVNELKKDGYDDFKIALVLNTTEYEIKKTQERIIPL